MVARFEVAKDFGRQQMDRFGLPSRETNTRDKRRLMVVRARIRRLW
jgi:hypothetical protein